MALNCTAVLADAILIQSILRTPTSYFRLYRNYFVAIYAFFLAFPLRELVLFFSPDEILLRLFGQFIVVSAVSIAILWGYLATKLYMHPQRFSLRDLLTFPVSRIDFGFFLYLVPMAATLAASLILPDAVVTSPAIVAVYFPSGETYRIVGYSSLFLAIASFVIVAFVAYPMMVLFYLRSQLKDREVRQALRVIAVCFGAISVMLLAFNALATFGYDVLGVTHIASIGLLFVVVRAFTRPTFLKAFLGVVPALDPILSSRREDKLVLIYRSQDEKFGPISRYIADGIDREALVVYFHREGEAIVREGLSRNGLGSRQLPLKGNLRMYSLQTLYRGEGIADEEAAIAHCRELASEAKTAGKAGLRVIIDYGDQTKRPLQKFVEHITDRRWTTADHYVDILMTFANSAFQKGQETALSMLRSRVQVSDLSESMDVFSRTVGLSHSEIAGRKILLEYSPVSDYERVLHSIVAESTSNFERTVVFTRRDSPLHSIIGEVAGLKTFVLTSRVSYPKVEGENRVLLPVYDSSLLLDAFNRTIEAYVGTPFTIIFDSISHYVHAFGPDRAYSFVRQALELIISNKITAIFLLNAGAHDERTVLTFENLFDLELVCREGARVPEVRKKLTVTG